MPPAPDSPSPIVGPFVVRSRKGSFGNQDLEAVLRMALAHRQDPDMEFLEADSGRRFTCAELIEALDRQDRRAAEGTSSPPPAGLTTFRSFATSTVDLDLLPLGPPAAAPAPPSGPPPAARRSDRMAKRGSDRKRAVDDGNGLLVASVVAAAVVVLVAGWLALHGR